MEESIKVDVLSGAEYRTCRGCGLCLLPCPVFKSTGDIRKTAHGRKKALQWGADIPELAEAIDECILCAACEPVCPVDNNDITGFTLRQRRALNKRRDSRPDWYPELADNNNVKQGNTTGEVALIIDKDSSSDAALAGLIDKIVSLLGGTRKVGVFCFDSDALEAGLAEPDEALKSLIGFTENARRIVATGGTTISHLRKRLSAKKIASLGETLLAMKEVTEALRPDDLLVIDSRAFNNDHKRLIRLYDRVIKDTGVKTNLDLNRVAIPTGADSLQ
ncbi:MAG: 4Fe-4S dicluster domain-containing protein, partial [Thermodesulfobacteriota bacterium]